MSISSTWLAGVWSGGRPAPAAGDLGILVVDDQLAACLYADRVLRLAGYQPVIASSGAEAVRKASAMPGVDVLVTDLMMPEMDGQQLAEILRRRDPELRVLYVTGFSDRLFAERAALCTGDAFLEKPYSVAALEQAFSMLAYGRLGRPERVPVCAAAPALWI